MFLPFYAATTNESGINKRYTVHLSKHIMLTKIASDITLLTTVLQIAYTIRFWKSLLTYAFERKIYKTFQVLERCDMKQNQNCHYFALRHHKFTVSFPLFEYFLRNSLWCFYQILWKTHPLWNKFTHLFLFFKVFVIHFA